MINSKKNMRPEHDNFFNSFLYLLQFVSKNQTNFEENLFSLTWLIIPNEVLKCPCEITAMWRVEYIYISVRL